jgi:phytoene synthase
MMPKALDATYRTRAIPPGSLRHWSWLFAARESQPPLLGVYALLAEWNALIDPATERSAAHIKLAWWREEMRRLVDGTPVHPISVYLKSLPRAAVVDFAPLVLAVDAAATELSGVPLERAADLEPQSQALRGNPLSVAAQRSQPLRQLHRSHSDLTGTGLGQCIGALALADYLSRSVEDYRREARQGRVPFAVDELVAVGIENSQLIAEHADPALQNYLDGLKARAAHQYQMAARALPPSERSAQRHLLVLAALGLFRLREQAPNNVAHRSPSGSARGWRTGLQEMYLAWSTARQAIRSTRS